MTGHHQLFVLVGALIVLATRGGSNLRARGRAVDALKSHIQPATYARSSPYSTQRRGRIIGDAAPLLLPPQTSRQAVIKYPSSKDVFDQADGEQPEETIQPSSTTKLEELTKKDWSAPAAYIGKQGKVLNFTDSPV